MMTCQGLSRKLLSSAVCVALFAAIGPLNLLAADKIVTNAQAIFAKAGGTKKDGMTQKQFQAAENRIDDALDRLTRDGVIGGDMPPPLVFKRDLSKKEKIDYTEFLQYFRGLASERDLQLRRELVDRAVAKKWAAQAAAEAAWENAQELRAEALAEWERQQANRDRDDDSRQDRQIRDENAELQRRNAELAWYLQHPRQPVPQPESKPTNSQQAQNGSTPGGSTGGPSGAGRPYKDPRNGPTTRPYGVAGATNGQRSAPSGNSGPSGGSPPKADKGASRDDKNSSKDDNKKSDDKSKKWRRWCADLEIVMSVAWAGSSNRPGVVMAECKVTMIGRRRRCVQY
jgi:hypothetical protein